MNKQLRAHQKGKATATAGVRKELLLNACSVNML
jgi:hypothetical protein